MPRLLDRLLRPLEAARVGTRARPRHPPLFVVGAPRCGTTLVALHLLNTFRFAYLPNVAKDHPLIPYLATRRASSRRGPAEDGNGSYDHRFGIAPGPLAPSDGWDVWNRFLPPYEVAGEERAGALAPMVPLVARLEELFDGPFFCKNNAHSTRIGALAAAFPDALFVHVRRAHPEAVSSLLAARRRHGVPLGRWWSAAAPRFLDHPFSDELEQAAATIWDLERFIEERLAELDPGRSTGVDYEDFCAHPDEPVRWVAARYAERSCPLHRRSPAPEPSFTASRLPEEERAPLASRIRALEATWAGADGAAEGT